MKQNQKKRFNNGRFNNRNQQKQITRNTVFDSTGPCGKLRGTPLQLTEKYQAGAKDALMQNDIVLAQTCMQYADHYIRLQNQAIQNEQRANQNNQMRMQRNIDELDQDDKVETSEMGETSVAGEEDSLPDIQVPSTDEGEATPLEGEEKVTPVSSKEGKKQIVVKIKRKPRVKKEGVSALDNAQEKNETPVEENSSAE